MFVYVLAPLSHWLRPAGYGGADSSAVGERGADSGGQKPAGTHRSARTPGKWAELQQHLSSALPVPLAPTVPSLWVPLPGNLPAPYRLICPDGGEP